MSNAKEKIDKCLKDSNYNCKHKDARFICVCFDKPSECNYSEKIEDTFAYFMEDQGWLKFSKLEEINAKQKKKENPLNPFPTLLGFVMSKAFFKDPKAIARWMWDCQDELRVLLNEIYAEKEKKHKIAEGIDSGEFIPVGMVCMTCDAKNTVLITPKGFSVYKDNPCNKCSANLLPVVKTDSEINKPEINKRVDSFVTAVKILNKKHHAKTIPSPEHPIQPLTKGTGEILRFKENEIIRMLELTGKINLNEIVGEDFSDEDKQQLMQLLGYSLSGYADLPFVTDKAVANAEELYKEDGINASTHK